MDKVINFIFRVFFFIIFFLIVTPIGILLRLAGIDYLQRQLEKGRNSYWIKKERLKDVRNR